MNFPLSNRIPHNIKALTCALCAGFCGYTACAQEWELKIQKGSIKVYTRALDSTRIREYKAVALIKTSVEKALAVIVDGNNLWKWNYKTPESKIVKTIAPGEFVFWIKNDLPWPLKNRDLAVRIKISRPAPGNAPGNTVLISIHPETTYLVPEADNTIRISRFKGYWLLVPKGDYVEVTQQLYGDPNGSLPTWMVNMLLTTAPYNTFLNLQKILEN